MSSKRELIAEALLEGSDVRERLLASGASEKVADYELERARKDPLFDAAMRLGRQLAKRDWTLQIHGKLAALRPGGLTVPTVSQIDPERFFADFYGANLPVIVTGLVDHWPALTKWTLDYLDDVVGDAVVEVQAARNSASDYELAKDRHKRTVRMRDLTAAIRSQEQSNDFYLTAYNGTVNNEALAKLWDDLAPVSLLVPGAGRDGFFWLGPKGTLTPFHHDLTNNLLVQVLGRKRVHLVPSWEVGRMKNMLHCFSLRQPGDWDADDPSLPTRLSCTIGPGDALFLPVGWWHHVEALDPSISMSFTNFAAENDFYSDYPTDTRF